MLAYVATPVVGLPDRFPSSQPTADYLPQSWSDHMELDRSNNAEPNPGSSREEEVTTEAQAQAVNDRRDTIGGLLAVLNPTASNKEEPVNAQVENSGPRVLAQEDGRLDAYEEQAQANAFHAQIPPLPPVTDMNENTNNMNGSIFAEGNYLPATPSQHDLPQPSYELINDSLPDSQPDFATPMPTKRQYDAFARLEFADGIFYLNTYQCELGRDQHAYRNALIRDKEAKEAADNTQNKPHSSSGKASRRSDGVKQGESQVPGSVVSEAGGFAGVDGGPVEGYDPKNDAAAEPSHPSQISESSGVHPAEVLRDPKLVPFDYGKNAVLQRAPAPEIDAVIPLPDDEQPAPVLPEHMPDPQSCPLIPIHTTMGTEQSEVESLKAISRRHVKIFWSWKYSSFYLEVLGRNGAFLDGEWYGQGKYVPLNSGTVIQISAVEFTFRLPIAQSDSVADDEDIEDEHGNLSHLRPSVSPVDDDISSSHMDKATTKLKLKLSAEAGASMKPSGPDGEPKRRGPGRPPKNGYMSQREMKELAKKKKEDEARAANGGRTPPPSAQRKLSKTQLPLPEPIQDITKPEKRKYTKRKREGEDGDVIQSIEGDDSAIAPEVAADIPPPKRARSKSVSPEYPAKEDLTQEALARPQQNYAQLLYHILEDGPAPLKDIYRRMKMRWPFFVHCVESDGWQSSVRHNLNQEVSVLFRKGPKEGKGYHWERIEGAIDAYNANKTKRSTAVSQPQRPRPPPQRPQFPSGQGQTLMWQNTGPYPQQQNGTNSFVNQTQYPQQQQNYSQSSARPPTGAPGQNGTSQAQAANGVHRPVSSQVLQTDGSTNGESRNKKTAPSYIPCSFQGLAAIRRFEIAMFTTVGDDKDKEQRWKTIFASVKARVLHGTKESTVPGGETDEERILLGYMQDFVNEYKNPDFTGFTVDVGLPVCTTPSLTQSSGTPGQPPATPGLEQSPQTLSGSGNNNDNSNTNADQRTSA